MRRERPEALWLTVNTPTVIRPGATGACSVFSYTAMYCGVSFGVDSPPSGAVGLAPVLNTAGPWAEFARELRGAIPEESRTGCAVGMPGTSPLNDGPA